VPEVTCWWDGRAVQHTTLLFVLRARGSKEQEGVGPSSRPCSPRCHTEGLRGVVGRGVRNVPHPQLTMKYVQARPGGCRIEVEAGFPSLFGVGRVWLHLMGPVHQISIPAGVSIKTTRSVVQCEALAHRFNVACVRIIIIVRE